MSEAVRTPEEVIHYRSGYVLRGEAGRLLVTPTCANFFVTEMLLRGFTTVRDTGATDLKRVIIRKLMFAFRLIPRRRDETFGTRNLRRPDPRSTVDPMWESNFSNGRARRFLTWDLRWFWDGLLRRPLGVVGACGGRGASGTQGHEGRVEGRSRVSLSSLRESLAFGSPNHVLCSCQSPRIILTGLKVTDLKLIDSHQDHGRRRRRE
jgi:hypothetical protein